MPQSYIEYSSGLTATTFSVPFKYLNIDNVNAIGFDGANWTALTVASRSASANTITLAAAPSTFTKIRVFRQSTTNQLVDFQAGARLTESELDTAYNQGLFVAQEVSEDANTVQFAKLADAALLGSTSLAAFNSSSHTGDNSTVTFTLSFTPQTSIPQGFLVIVDGVLQSPVDAYTISIAPAQITFTSAPPTGASIVVTTAAAATGTPVSEAIINGSQLVDTSVPSAKLSGSITADKLTNIATTTIAPTGATTARSLSNKLSDVVSVKDFGAVGDGTTDDKVALLAALNASTGKTLDGGGATYRVDSKMLTTADNITVQNMTIDFSNAPDQVAGGVDRMLEFAGSAGTPQTLTQNRDRGDFTLQVGSTSDFSVDQWCILESDKLFDTSQSVTLGQYVCIKSVDSGTQVTVHNDLLYDFATADNAQLVPITMKKNITFRDVNFKGAAPTETTSTHHRQGGLVFERCQDVTVDNCKFEDIDYTALIVSRCVNFSSSDCTMRNANLFGNSYGYGIQNASYGVSIINGYGEDLRHFVAIGDNEGVNLFVNVTNCHVTACRDAGIDSHAAADFVNFSGNTIEGSAFDSGQLDGIIFQGLNCVINDNMVIGVRRHGIFHQVLPSLSYADGGQASAVISGNTVINHGGASGTDVGILYQHNSSSSETDSVVISNNSIKGNSDSGITVQALGGSVKNVNVTSNVVEHSIVTGITIRTASAANTTVSNLVIDGNIVTNTGGTGAEGIYLLGESATSKIIKSVVSNNVVQGNMQFGFRASFNTSLIVNSNILKDTTGSSATFYSDCSDNVEANTLS